MARPNGKSVRLSNEALAIVEKAPGEGFNDKFEKLIFAYHNTISSRQKKLDILKQEIIEQQTKLEELKLQTGTWWEITSKMHEVERNVDDLKMFVSQDRAAGASRIKHNEIQNYEQITLD